MNSDNFDFEIKSGLFLRRNPNKYYSNERGYINRKLGFLKKENIDYSNMSHFWQLNVEDGKTLRVRVCDEFSYNVEETYNSIGDFKKDFIGVLEFLDQATFVGKQFKRTAPSYSSTGYKDISFMGDSGEHIALYCTKDLFLVKSTYFGLQPKYKLVTGHHISDGKYEIFGPEHEEYRDKNKVYFEILAQINECNRGRGRKH